MLVILSGFPDDVLAISATGEVTGQDYREVFVPAVSAKLKVHKHLKLVYCLGTEFSGFSAGAMWKDARIGIAHWTGWGRIAVVTDVKWIADAVLGCLRPCFIIQCVFSAMLRNKLRACGS